MSITLVIGGHWFPLGPSSWQLNAAAAGSGMALFFCLSGFLITYFLLDDARPWPFVVKRVTRIVPLAWAAVLILYLANEPDWQTLSANLLFIANLPPSHLMHGGNHLWSLGVEMQFYVFAAALVALGGRRGLFILPIVCVAVTGLRVESQQIYSIVTWHRVDEILVGSCVALIWHFRREVAFVHPVWSWLPIVALALLLASANPHAGALGYLRPYFAGFAIGSSLFAFPRPLLRTFVSPPARYIAKVSYALYVVHGMLTVTWLGGEGATKAERYALRIPLVCATFIVAHLSTYYYEKAFSNWARKYLKTRDDNYVRKTTSA